MSPIIVILLTLIHISTSTLCGPNIRGTLNKKCSKKYPEHLIEKYLDEIVNRNDLYAFYEEINKKFIFLTQKRQELTECEILEIEDPRIFTCLTGNRTETITYDVNVFNTTLQCFTINEDFRLLFADELADYCGYVPDERIGSYVIHYVSYPDEETIKHTRILKMGAGRACYFSLLTIGISFGFIFIIFK